MRALFYYDIYARHDVIIESACLWLEDVSSIQNSKFMQSLAAVDPALAARPLISLPPVTKVPPNLLCSTPTLNP